MFHRSVFYFPDGMAIGFSRDVKYANFKQWTAKERHRKKMMTDQMFENQILWQIPVLLNFFGRTFD